MLSDDDLLRELEEEGDGELDVSDGDLAALEREIDQKSASHFGGKSKKANGNNDSMDFSDPNHIAAMISQSERELADAHDPKKVAALMAASAVPDTDYDDGAMDLEGDGMDVSDDLRLLEEEDMEGDPAEKSSALTEEQIKAMKLKVIELKKAGKLEEAKQLYMQLKSGTATTTPATQLATAMRAAPPPAASNKSANVSVKTSGVNTNSSPASTAAPPSSASPPAVQLIIQRQRSFINLAKKSQSEGRKETATILTLGLRQLKGLLEDAKKNPQTFDSKKILPPPTEYLHKEVERLEKEKQEKEEKTSKNKGPQSQNAKGNAVVDVKSKPVPPPSSLKSNASTTATSTPSPTPGSDLSYSDKLSVRQRLEYATIVGKLDDQIRSLAAAMKRTLDEGGGSKQSKLIALQYHRLRKESLQSRDLLSTAAKQGIPPPTYSTEEVPLTLELRFDSIKEEEMTVEITHAKNLGFKGIVDRADDLSTYVNGKIDWPPESSQSFHTPVVSKSGDPQYNFSSTLKLGPRSKTTARRIGSAKLHLNVYHKRRLLSDLLVGTAEIRLKALATKAEMKETVKLRTSENKPKGGDLEVIVRIRAPMLPGLLDLRQEKLEYVKISEFDEDKGNEQHNAQKTAVNSTELVDLVQANVALKQGELGKDLDDDDERRRSLTPHSAHSRKSSSASNASSASAASAASAASTASANGEKRQSTISTAKPRATTPTPTPTAQAQQGKSELLSASSAASSATSASSSSSCSSPSSSPSAAAKSSAGAIQKELENPHNPNLFVSNDVLEAEIQLTQESVKHAQGDELMDLQSHLSACQIRMTLIVTQVQKGLLSLDQYLDQLRAAIQREGSLAIALKTAGNTDDAIRVAKRVKIMKTELANAESNKEQLE